MSRAELKRTPQRIGIYRLNQKLGSGAAGDVYEATHEVLGKKVALKLLRLENADEEAHIRFLKEGVTAAKVRHANVVSVTDAGIDHGQPYLVMELLEGESLGHKLMRDGALPIEEAVDIIVPLAAALASAHSSGVLHRDLKPSNIYLADVGKPKLEPMLLDFGIAKMLAPVDPELTIQPQLLGTPLYLSPEQADGKPGSALSDQYSLALTLYECLLNIKPFERYAHSFVRLLKAIAEGNFPTPKELDPKIPNELNDILLRSLACQPTERFSNLREFGGALLPFASESIRGTWGDCFAQHDHTMTSASSPLLPPSTSRPVSVTMDSSGERPRAEHLSATFEDEHDTQPSSFMSHSSLFGTEELQAHSSEGSSDRFAANDDSPQSSVSRREGSAAQSHEAPGFSQAAHWQQSKAALGLGPPGSAGPFSSEDQIESAPPAQRPSHFGRPATSSNLPIAPSPGPRTRRPIAIALGLGFLFCVGCIVAGFFPQLFPMENRRETQLTNQLAPKLTSSTKISSPKPENSQVQTGQLEKSTQDTNLKANAAIVTDEKATPQRSQVKTTASPAKRLIGKPSSTSSKTTSPTPTPRAVPSASANNNTLQEEAPAEVKEDDESPKPEAPKNESPADAKGLLNSHPSTPMPSGNLNPWETKNP